MENEKVQLYAALLSVHFKQKQVKRIYGRQAACGLPDIVFGDSVEIKAISVQHITQGEVMRGRHKTGKRLWKRAEETAKRWHVRYKQVFQSKAMPGTKATGPA